MSDSQPRARRWPVWLCLLAAGALWGAVTRQFGPQWTIYTQYNYGWGVPFLCVYLFWERWQTRPLPEAPQARCWPWLVAGVAALLLALARWAHEANTTWRITTWLMALCAVGITLSGIYQAGGRRWAKYFFFPVAFFLVAVPWPSQWEVAVIQGLTRMNVAATVETLAFAGIPAMQHGNVIEVGTGVVGIDEACSGIRSLQATLMIALFFGELYRFGTRRRLGLVGIGIGLAFLFNVGRTFLLVFVAARQGIEAIAKWHDPAGVTILVGCFCGLWGAAGWLKPKEAGGGATSDAANPARTGTLPAGFLAAVTLWIAMMELGTEAWYRAHESGLFQPPQWSVHWPEEKPQFQFVTLADRVRSTMLYDEGKSAKWSGEDGTLWQAFYFTWFPARTLTERVKVQSAKSHRPEVCLPASGIVQRADLGLVTLEAGGLRLPFHRYVFEDKSGPIYVYYCFWEDGGNSQSQMLENPLSRLSAARNGVRGLGERILEVALAGVRNESEAEAVVTKLLKEIIVLP